MIDLNLCRCQIGEDWVFSVRSINGSLPERTVVVNYEGFAEGVASLSLFSDILSVSFLAYI